ncbi:MAG: single-strand DNA-binding protein [Arenicella sp.]
MILVAGLGNDPDVRYAANDSAITNSRVATKKSWKNNNAGEQQDRTEWHRVVMFNRLGEIAGEFLKQGLQVYIEGRLQIRKWQDQSGQDKYSIEIVASDM